VPCDKIEHRLGLKLIGASIVTQSAEVRMGRDRRVPAPSRLFGVETFLFTPSAGGVKLLQLTPAWNAVAKMTRQIPQGPVSFFIFPRHFLLPAPARRVFCAE
jgi:hypothetical protein